MCEGVVEAYSSEGGGKGVAPSGLPEGASSPSVPLIHAQPAAKQAPRPSPPRTSMFSISSGLPKVRHSSKWLRKALSFSCMRGGSQGEYHGEQHCEWHGE